MDDHSDYLAPHKIKRWGKRIWIENTLTKEEFYHGDATPFWYKMLGNERDKMNSKVKLIAPWRNSKVDT
jgi:hypothetical protein